MTIDELWIRRVIVCGGALVYWAGVLVQGRRVRKKIGYSPNLKPCGKRELLLWLGWMLVILIWIAQPLLASPETRLPGLLISVVLLNRVGFTIGTILTVTGYAATIWCYNIMGNAWRIGINPEESNQLITSGPYSRIRHPIYAFQAMMLLGTVCLLPTTCSVAVFALHLALVLLKAKDEEAYLLKRHGSNYREHVEKTWRLLPKIW